MTFTAFAFGRKSFSFNTIFRRSQHTIKTFVSKGGYKLSRKKEHFSEIRQASIY